jgi:hypothetical protein
MAVPPLTLTLTQTKVYTGAAPRTERFGVQSTLVASVPTTQQLEAAFVIGPATGVDRERLLRIVNLDEPADQTLINTAGTFNKLKFFRDLSLNLAASVFGGDVLRVTTPPGEWSPDGNLLPTADYPILGVDVPNQRIEMVTPFFWAAQNLTYTILAPDLVTVRVPTQSTGMTERQTTVLSEWRCDQFVAAFGTSTEAFDHIASTQAFVASLGQQTKLNIDEFLDAGGNPIVNTY